MATNLLQELMEAFPQADPASEFHGEEINGCDAVNFLSEFIPEVRKHLDNGKHRENKAFEVLKACWNFIENVTDDDPQRSDKFFALRERVRNVLWERHHEPPTMAVILEGGLVQYIICDHPGNLPPLKVMVLDYDSEGVDEEDLLQVPQDDGSFVRATGRYEGIEQADINLTAVMEQLDARGW